MARSTPGELPSRTLSVDSADTSQAALVGFPLQGRYRLGKELGRGGMGRVFAAYDLKLGREVAIKILPPGGHDEHQLRRFEQEARAAGSLNHPNIIAVYDVGVFERGPFIVSELLHGSTLRVELSGKPLLPRKAIDYAIQLAHGLAAAHEKGVVHRDLKPENLFITSEGHLKVLDFGIAKLTATNADSGSQQMSTQTGTILGTFSYMSPEQVRGHEADSRSDIFAFGTILFEMLSGTRPFRGGTTAEIAAAILESELAELPDSIVPELDQIVHRCLEKRPEQRFQSSRDLAFSLEQLRTPRDTGRKPPSRSRGLVLAAIGLLAFMAVAAAFLIGRRSRDTRHVNFQRLTFRRGVVWSARFGTDGQTVLYSAAWDGQPIQLYTTAPGSLESRAHDIPGTLLAVSSTSELATVSGRGQAIPRPGTLAVASLFAGAPRELLTDTMSADWTPSGELAVIRKVETQSRLELPPGNVLYQSTHRLSDLRVSRRGDRIAFIDRPGGLFDLGGIIKVLDRTGRESPLTPYLVGCDGLAWSPDDEEIWFSGNDLDGHEQSVRAVTLTGQSRLLARLPGSFTIHDVARDGRVLLARVVLRLLMRGRAPGAAAERDLGWLGHSSSADLSYDGKLLLFGEFGEGGGPKGRAYVRGTDGSPPIKIADSVEGGPMSMSLSPDGTRAMLPRERGPEVVIVPVGAGEPVITRFPVAELFDATWFPDGKRILFTGREQDSPVRVFVLEQDGKAKVIADGTALPLSTFKNTRPVSRDGKSVVLKQSGKFMLYPVDGGNPQPLPGIPEGDYVIGWGADNNSLLVRKDSAPPIAVVDSIDLRTGRRTPWRTLAPPDPTGVTGMFNIRVASGDAYVYTYVSTLSELYLATGLY